MNEKFKYLVTVEDEGEKIKNIIKRQFSLSSRLMTKLKTGDCVFLNDSPVKLYVTPVAGDIIKINFPYERSEFVPENIDINIVYEDSDILIINKQPGHVVHPTKGHPTGTMANGIMKYMIDSAQSFKIRFINRLDMDTSGLLIVAKNSHCQDNLSKQMKNNRVSKEYIAIVKGIVSDDSGTVNAPIGRLYDDHVLRGVTPDGYPSTTNYKVIDRYESGFSLLRLRLETGRTHQIRVHMNHIGHPVLSDSLYDEQVPDIISRQALHAAYLSFVHPISGKLMEFDAPMPEDMCKAVSIISQKRF